MRFSVTIERLARAMRVLAGLALTATAAPLPVAANEPWYMPGQTWTGVGGRRGAEDWTIEIVFAADGTARIDYPSIPCGGTLTATDLDHTRGVFTENITRQPENCANRGTVTLVPLDGKTLAYSYEYTSGSVARGRLALAEASPAGALSAQASQLELDLARPSTPAPTVPGAPSSDADTVRSVQQQLTAMGYDPGPADGIVGLRTRRAIRAFQTARGFTVDGDIGEPLLAALAGRAVADTTAASPLAATGMPMLTGSAAASRLARACDILAAHPDDAQAVVDGVEDNELDGAVALDACRQARLATPGLDRLAFQEARALIKLQRYTEARELLSPLAAAEHAPAQYLLGSTYVEGSGPPPAEPARAVEWYERAAARGFAPAQAALASAHYNGNLRLRANYQEAVRIAQSAATQGNPHGMAILGHAYETGQGVGVSSGEALRWYRGAAEAGHAWSLQQIERFDPEGARQIGARAEAAQAAREAAYAERQREAQEILAAVRPTLQVVASVDAPTMAVERLEDLDWAISAKLRGDVALVARALAAADPGDAVAATDEVSVMRALLDGAPLTSLATTTPPAVAWALLNSGSVDPGQPTLLDPEQTALMREVAWLDPNQENRESAFALYLAGEGALTSPLGTAGAAALQRELQTRLQRIAASLRAAPSPQTAGLVIERLDQLDQRLGQAGIALAGDAPGGSGTLAALGGAFAAAAAAPPETLLDFELALLPEPDGWIRLAGRLREPSGQPLAEVGQRLQPTAALASERLLTATGEAGKLAADLAFLMLAVLPTELERTAQLVAATLADIEQNLGLAAPVVQPASVEPVAAPSPPAPPAAEPGVPLFPAAPAPAEAPAAMAAPEPLAASEAPTMTELAPPDAVVAALPQAAARTATVRLEDGSEIAAGLVDGNLIYRSAFGELTIDVATVAALDEESLQLTDGTVLRGTLVGGQLNLATGFGEHTLDAQSIRGIVIRSP